MNVRTPKKKNYTKEMEKWFNERTARHINLVKKYAALIDKYDHERFGELIDIAANHDKSKYGKVERDPYIFISWYYKCKNEGKDYEIPEDIKSKVDKAVFHHIKNNKHHPEFYDDRVELGKEDDILIDGTKMPDIYIAEMCVDWMAMSEELNNSAKDWADKGIGKKWKFTDQQKTLIYEILNNIKVS